MRGRRFKCRTTVGKQEGPSAHSRAASAPGMSCPFSCPGKAYSRVNNQPASKTTPEFQKPHRPGFPNVFGLDTSPPRTFSDDSTQEKLTSGGTRGPSASIPEQLGDAAAEALPGGALCGGSNRPQRAQALSRAGEGRTSRVTDHPAPQLPPEVPRKGPPRPDFPVLGRPE